LRRIPVRTFSNGCDSSFEVLDLGDIAFRENFWETVTTPPLGSTGHRGAGRGIADDYHGMMIALGHSKQGWQAASRITSAYVLNRMATRVQATLVTVYAAWLPAGDVMRIFRRRKAA
jgi:hypothetical protein